MVAPKQKAAVWVLASLWQGGCHAAEALEPGEGAFDEVAPLVGVGADGVQTLAVRRVADHRLRATGQEQPPERAVVVGAFNREAD